MNGTLTVEALIGDKSLRIETGLLALQAKGSCTVHMGDTVLFSAVTATETPREGVDYFPLQVEYREKFYAAGMFPGGFFKRESRPSEKEILTARFTDRPLRPLFQKGYQNDVQVVNMLLSADGQHESDILSIVAGSTSLVLSDLPFFGPIGAVRVGRVNGQWVFNPTHAERAQSDLDLIYACNREMPVMIEGEAREISEKDILAAMKAAHQECIKIIDMQLALRRKCGLPDKVVADLPQDNTLLNAARTLAGDTLSEALLVPGKLERRSRIATVKSSLKTQLQASFPDMTDEAFRAMFDQLEISIVRSNVLQKKRRIDGRGFDDIRALRADVSLLPRTHGSALFSRGETQALCTVTLGSKSDAQSQDCITGGQPEKAFMLHYNFPPYSVGETGRYGSVGRREMGHGALAERSLDQMMPKDYAYTVRVVSDIMGSNGSTSMATVCAGTLALMDAGVPMAKPVAGISVGLFTGDQGEAAMVTDIIGDEDHCGDMDFKVAGTRDGITGFQVDLKIRGLPWAIVEGAFTNARQARLKILDYMQSVIATPREDMCKYAPRIKTLKINPEKIGALIGPGGKNIRRITDMTKAQIDINDDGTVNIFSADAASMDMAFREVSLITSEPEEGVLYNGTVTGIKEFGAFVEIIPGIDGLVHISELADFRVKSVEDICKVGDQMWVKCVGIDDRGRVKLSRRAAMQEKGTST